LTKKKYLKVEVKRTVVADESANNIGGRSENGCIYPIPK
jgi:hypothetical protein